MTLLSSEDRKDAIKRLRASRKEAIKELSDRGREDGRDYALHHASYIELERIQKKSCETGPNPEMDSLRDVAIVLGGEDWNETLQDILGVVNEDDTEHAEWVEAFCDGLIDTYERIRGAVLTTKEEEAV